MPVDPALDDFENLLSDSALGELVEVTLRPLGPNTYRARSEDGWVVFSRSAADGAWVFEELEVSGRNPLGDQATDRFLGHAHERSMRFPHRSTNAYPHAYDSVAQFFDARYAPDLLVTHTAAHFTGGYLGQHGSLGTVQARAPFLASGAGVRQLGVVDRATRVVNIAPTIAALMGLDPNPAATGPTGAPRPGAFLARQDGDTEWDILTGESAGHVVVFLLDGCNANLLNDVIDAGEAPNMARLLGTGTMFGRGSIASLPTATLANHTTAITGAHPGHSGILHNNWIEPGATEPVDLLSLGGMFTASQHLAAGVETIFEAVHRSRPGAFNAATFEYCDRGADFSSFELVRSGRQDTLPDLDSVDHLSAEHASFGDLYRFISRVDHQSTTHLLECWNGAHGDRLPDLSWCSLALTDEAGHHSGPHGEGARAAVRDSDARIGDVLEAVERAGVFDDSAFLVIADHGMEQADPDLDRTWDSELASLGVPYSEVGGGFIYLGVD
ncbi:MAG: alkaline phosphatase family protein [Microthrixaceae bacterium]|nr:alkaline phosphatase family protein [Microthrixaceae bacterium]